MCGLPARQKLVASDVKIQRIIKDEADLDLYVYGNPRRIFKQLAMKNRWRYFFLDIRDFTPFIEKHLPFDVIHIIRRLNILFNEVIHSA